MSALEVAGLHNLRDAGRVLTASGVRVRPGLLMRSAAPLRPREPFAKDLRRVGVRRILDLRDDMEKAMTGSWAGFDVIVNEVPVFENRLAHTRWDTLADLYTVMLQQHSRALARAVDVVAAAPQEPILVHCTAGKDRTGVVVALVLRLLGVGRETVLVDYSASQDMLGGDYLADLAHIHRVAEVPGIHAHRATASPAHLLDDALAAAVDPYGDVENYLLANGLNTASPENLRTVLLEDSDRPAPPALLEPTKTSPPTCE